MNASTALIPVDPALSPERLSRVLTISADLMPPEIVAARRARRTRAVMVVVLALVLAGLGGWYVHADRQLSQADEDLTVVSGQASTLQRRQADYADVVNVQADTKAITEQLKTLLAQDLPWATLIDTLRATGRDAGVTVAGLSGSLKEPANAAGTAALPGGPRVAPVGTFIVTGTAPDKPSVAKYVDELAGQAILVNPYPTSVTEEKDGTVQFTLSVDIAADALCGRFTTACKPTGGN